MSDRPDPAAYAIAGMTPRAVARPASPEEAAGVLRAAARDRLAVVPWGGGVGLSRTGAPARYDVALDLTALDAIVAHEPDDLTLTAGCGATLATLRAAAAAHGQELPLEAALAERATLGGILAANASGPRRLRLGSPRDRVLGARFALGDGTLARSGGRVVKNVAGYAVHRLLCGSRGGLGVLLEATLKLEPAPARRVALVFGAGPRGLGDAARWAELAALEPAALTVVGGGPARELPVASPTDPFTLIAGLEDDEARVDQQAEALVRMLGEPDARLEGEAVAELWQALADLEERDGVRLTFTGGGRPNEALAPLLEGPARGRMRDARAGRAAARLPRRRRRPRAGRAAGTGRAHAAGGGRARGAGAVPAPAGRPARAARAHPHRAGPRRHARPRSGLGAAGVDGGVVAGAGRPL